MVSFVICLLFVTLLLQPISTTLTPNSNYQSSIMAKLASTQHIAVTINNSNDFHQYLNGFLNKTEQLALLFDFDGTLAPLTANPNATSMSPYTKSTLQKFATNPHIFLGIISGRGVNDVKDKVQIQNITYGGNHGIEIENPNGSRSDYQLPINIHENYIKMVAELKEKLDINGAFVEDKIQSLTYHYRNVPEELMDIQKNQAIEIIKKYDFLANQAHFAIEAKPPVNWNKGEAALFILKNQFGENWSDKIKVIFAGDDTTDEDAMKALQGITGTQTFRISTNPKFETYADYRLTSQTLIPELIKWIESIYY